MVQLHARNKSLIIHSRFCGPKDSGNGGYVCGRLAHYFEGITEVTLRKPPPLDTKMQIVKDGTVLHLMCADEIIATVKSGTLDFEAPKAPSFDSAMEFSKNYIGFQEHPYPSCFVCGPQRESPDALCIFPGKTSDGKMVAAPWVPGEHLSDENGLVKNEFIWSALDCPGGIVALEETKNILLGRMTTQIKNRIAFNEKCVVIGWLKEKDGRKYYSGTALYSETKGLCTVANAVWIDPK